MIVWPNQSLSATPKAFGAAPSVLDGVGDGLRPNFVAVSFSAPVPELTSEVIRQGFFGICWRGF